MDSEQILGKSIVYRLSILLRRFEFFVTVAEDDVTDVLEEVLSLKSV